MITMFEIGTTKGKRKDPQIFLSLTRGKFSEIDAEINSISGKITRFMETGDLKRLIRLRGRLTSLQAALDDIKLAEIERKKPSFRHSYSFYDYQEILNTLN